ncbi:MAG: AAA family ATPase [Zetaproteobacteria bacterium]|nr:AAA family ATPase [Zetaproteobacteria bacterium]
MSDNGKPPLDYLEVAYAHGCALLDDIELGLMDIIQIDLKNLNRIKTANLNEQENEALNGMLGREANQREQTVRDQFLHILGLENSFDGSEEVSKAAGILSQGITWDEMAGLIGDVSWAWQPWLPRGFVTIVAAEVGIGKSVLCLRIAASILCGELWPDNSAYESERGAVLWCETEAAQALNMARAKAWGLPIDKIYSPKIDDNPITDVALDLTQHQDQVSEMANWPDVRLIVVDSLRGAHRGDENSSSIEVVKWLAQLARDTDKPVLLTHHLRKRGLLDLDGIISLDRVRGSSAIIQTSRVVWAIDRPDIEIEARRLSVIKSNLTRFPDPVGLEINDAGIEFGEAPEKPHEDTPTERAVDLLRALLADGPMKQPDIEDEAKGAGIAWNAVRQAKKRLNIVSKRKDLDGWYWALPAK